MPRRSYAQYCAIARALDTVGDRWTLLIARELLAGPRRYTDLHADLPGVSTDMLASRLKDLERDGILTRRRLSPPASASVYELTPRGRALLPVLSALADWGADGLAERRPTDAVRAHWFAVPLMLRLRAPLATRAGVVEVRLPEGVFHLRFAADTEPTYGDGPAERADAALALDGEVCAELARDAMTVAEAVASGAVRVSGEGAVADTLRGDGA
ncbi:helix-turn-helix domain-containing protein [Streptomyces sp. XD-27]|uniref:winged helix-turn-helix transcriptional regulator n=1 Tax=Streptomyces sp. XD-27 TaxID=3062779 RepID=UPI0026F47E06|nr:helix-turn-helix domain-containing protein [Streptomyces sp. XD-27]WKX70806.1 helix-turn-helix domain-containing protein [Streptomyces sp. XD-27]